MAGACRAALWVDPGSVIALTSGDWTTLASWGVTDLVVYISGGAVPNTSGSWLNGFGGSQDFGSSPGGGASWTLQNDLGAAGVSTSVSFKAHAVGIKVFLAFYLENTSASNAPCAGDWFNSSTWTTWNTAVENLAAGAAWCGFDGLAFDTEGDGGITWQYNYTGNSNSLATTQSEASTRGQAMGTAIVTGFGGPCPILIYQSDLTGAQLPNGYYDSFQAWQLSNFGTNVQGGPPSSSTFKAFITGVATNDSADIYCCDSTFYSYQNVTTNQGPYSGDPNPWASALNDQNTAQAALNTSGFPHVHVTEFLWPGDNTVAAGGDGQWSQAAWNGTGSPPGAMPYVQNHCNGALISIYNYDDLLSSGISGGSFTVNYANYTQDFSNVDYTPLDGTAGDPPTITEDASQPTPVHGTGSGGTSSITTASFSPPANSLLAATISATNFGGGAETGTVSFASGGSGLSWSLPSGWRYNGAGPGGTCETWICQVGATAPGAMTVHAATTGGIGTTTIDLVVKVLVGAATGPAAEGATAGDVYTSTDFNTEISITPTNVNSYMVIAAMNGNNVDFNGTALANTTQDDVITPPSDQMATAIGHQNPSNTTTSETVGWDIGSNPFVLVAAWEILPGTGTGALAASVALTGTGAVTVPGSGVIRPTLVALSGSGSIKVAGAGGALATVNMSGNGSVSGIAPFVPPPLSSHRDPMRWYKPNASDFPREEGLDPGHRHTHFGDRANESGAIYTAALESGIGVVLDTFADRLLFVDTTGAGSVVVALAPDGTTYSNLFARTLAATDTIELLLPRGWGIKITLTTSTFVGDALYY